MKYCCDTFKMHVENPPDGGFGRHIEIIRGRGSGKWQTNFSDGEYGDIELNFCPFCGAKLD